jgi:hypothetical protein
MLRFIFVCMGVVALSLVAIGAQYITDGISNEADNVIARNAEQAPEVQAVAAEDSISPEDLNAIETTAGTPSFDPNDTFTGGFTNEAPKGLEDDVPAATPVQTMATEEQAN